MQPELRRTKRLCCLIKDGSRVKCHFCGIGFCEDCYYKMKFGFGGRVAHDDCAKEFAKPPSTEEFMKELRKK